MTKQSAAHVRGGVPRARGLAAGGIVTPGRLPLIGRESGYVHEHHFACAFGSPDCPAFGEAEPPRVSWLRRLLRLTPPGSSEEGAP